MTQKTKSLRDCRTARDYRTYSEARGGTWVSRGKHSGVEYRGSFVPVPVHSRTIPDGTRCAIARSFRAIGLAVLVLMLVAGGVLWF